MWVHQWISLWSIGNLHSITLIKIMKFFSFRLYYVCLFFDLHSFFFPWWKLVVPAFYGWISFLSTALFYFTSKGFIIPLISKTYRITGHIVHWEYKNDITLLLRWCHGKELNASYSYPSLYNVEQPYFPSRVNNWACLSVIH